MVLWSYALVTSQRRQGTEDQIPTDACLQQETLPKCSQALTILQQLSVAPLHRSSS